MTTRTHADPPLWIPLLMGALLFFGLGGASILDPQNIQWLMRAQNDPQTNLFGWEYFRHTPLLQFPLGANPDYGMELGSSIVFSDSLPLFALPFKFVATWLPETFQYFGLWVLTCLVLQALFGYLLLSRFTAERAQLILGTTLLLLLPAYLMRFTIHLALGAHWLLLAGLYLYFDRRYRSGAWLLLLALATSIHAYLLVMLAAIWAADLLQRLQLAQVSLLRCSAHGLLGSAEILVLMWLLGYFMLGAAPNVADQYGRMNLLALVDPSYFWSRLLPGQPLDFWDSDGFAYLGVGGIAVVLLASALMLLRSKSPRFHARLPLLLMALLLTTIALTNTINFGLHTLVHFDLPPWATRLYQVFRSPGRLFWPVYYLLVALSLVLIVTRLPRRLAMSALLAAVLVQVYDVSGGLARTRGIFRDDTPWISPLRSSLWPHLAERYQYVRYIRPENSPNQFIALVDFSVQHRLPINSGYFARIDPQAQDNAQRQLAERVRNGRYERDTLYVFNDPSLWDLALKTLGPQDRAGILDGLPILLPAGADCTVCQNVDLVPRHWGHWSAAALPTLIGQLHDGRLVSQPGQAGYLSYGPYTHLTTGRLHYRIRYSASAGADQAAGSWDITDNADQKAVVLAQGNLPGTAGQVAVIEGDIDLRTPFSAAEVRTLANGSQTLQLIELELTQPEGAPPGR